MKLRKHTLFTAGFIFLFVGLVMTAKPTHVAFAGFTSTPTSVPDTPAPPPTDTPVPVATDTPVPATSTPRPASTPRTNTPTQPVDTPIPTPDSIPELGSGPSTNFIRFGIVSLVFGAFFIFAGWLKLLKTE